jgi:AraC family transcriptional regulator
MNARKLPGDFEGSRLVEHALAPFSIRAVTVLDEGQEVGSHTHEQAHVMLVVAGEYLRRERGAFEPIRPPFLMFDPAGTTHDDRFARSEGAFVSLSIVHSTGLSVPDEPLSLRFPGAIRAALCLARDARSRTAESTALEGAAWEVLASIEDTPEPIHPPPWAFDADLVMDEAADPEISVGKIAARTNVHPVHLARVFRNEWGCAPAELLRWRRVERAAELLAKRELPPAEIALSLGFCDQSHMNRAFKAFFGVAPSRWQRLAMLRESKTIRPGAN